MDTGTAPDTTTIPTREAMVKVDTTREEHTIKVDTIKGIRREEVITKVIQAIPIKADIVREDTISRPTIKVGNTDSTVVRTTNIGKTTIVHSLTVVPVVGHVQLVSYAVVVCDLSYIHPFIPITVYKT